jgi:signal transduction histidine kinase
MDDQDVHPQTPDTVERLLHEILVEIRTPLTAIKYYSHILREVENANLTDEQRKYVHIISQNTEGVLAIYNDVFNRWMELHKKSREE